MLKHRNKKTTIDCITFDSKKEAARFFQLKMMQQTGIIKDLELQPKFKIADRFVYQGKKHRERYYIADFKYSRNDDIIVEDVKSPHTSKLPLYRLKRHLFLSQYGDKITFLET